ncbi:MAG TPA: hypothetical protein VHA09_01255 [Nitrososphaera sp.]|nr:hypothetical protein [Nitrososphaera sp.]
MTSEAGMMLFPTGGFTLLLLAIALGIFAWLAAKSRSIRSFQFQISLFIVIWIIGEMIDALQERDGMMTVMMPHSHQEIGMYVHVLAMGLFSAMLWTRFFLSKRSGKRMTDGLQGGGEGEE